MLRTRYDIFLSYSRADGERVKPLLDQLRRLGYRVFFDVQSIDPGERWKNRLDRSIRASRTLVLCWSEHARGSDYITFEYSRAEALHKPVYPWIMDGTPLPAMLEIQGVPSSDPAMVAAALRPKLGWPMRLRWLRQAIVAVLLAATLSFLLWTKMHPPPWEFAGRVVDAQTLQGLPGVHIAVVDRTDHHEIDVTSGKDGSYHLALPEPRPAYLNLRSTKEGYTGDERNFSTSKPPDDWPLTRSRPAS